jgi:hypothetical protein
MIKSRRMRWAGNVARMGEMRNAYNILIGKPETKRPLERSRRRWEYKIRMELNRNRVEGVDRIHLIQWRALVNTVMNLWVP